MPTFTLPDNFTVTDAEFTESKQEQERVYSIEGNRQAGRSYLDGLGHARWDTDYVTMRMAGYTHQAALQEMRVRIREAWTPPLPPLEQHVPPPNNQPIPPAGLLLGPGNFRTPDPAPGAPRLALPSYGLAVVESVGRAFPQLLRNSCQSAGGNWEWLDWCVDTLRTHDQRWGYNGKRGNANDPSQDVVTFHYGPGPESNSTEVYIVDVIGGHCGASPSAIFNDVTDATAAGGTIGRWISRGRF